MEEEILRVEGVTKSFGGFVALNGVDVSIGGHGITSIIGPNGAGKTTLINVVSGRLKPDKGRIFFGRKDITGLPTDKIVKLGVARTFQIINIFGNLTVYQNILIAALSRMSRHAEPEAESLLRELGLEDYRDLEAYKLPHGFQRLLEIAVALATKPKLLLLDEPTAGLNPSEKERVVQLMKDIGKRICVVLVEHDMDVVFNISKRILVMHRGEVVADGLPEEIRENRTVKEIYLGE